MTDKIEKNPEVFQKMEELLDYFQKGKALTQTLIGENEKLKRQMLQLEKENLALQSQGDTCQHGADAESEQTALQKAADLERRLHDLERENAEFAARYVKIQEQNDKLLNLYVSTYQLHATLDRAEVQRSITEILINLIGAEEYFICLLDASKKSLEVVISEGTGLPPVGSAITALDHLMEAVLREGASFYQDAAAEASDAGLAISQTVPYLACLPLRVKDEVMGVIAIKKLMDHKGGGLTSIDHELLDMLADHAATALVSSELYSRVERKLRAAEGFMSLLKLKKDLKT